MYKNEYRYIKYMFPESPDCTLYDDTQRNGFWVTGGEPGVIEVLKVWKWPIVHRSKFWPIYWNISHNFFFSFSFSCCCLSEVCDVRRVPLLCACYVKMAAKIFEVKKKSDGVPAHQLFWDLRDIYRLQADGPRISHAEPSSKVGSPEYMNINFFFLWNKPQANSLSHISLCHHFCTGSKETETPKTQPQVNAIFTEWNNRLIWINTCNNLKSLNAKTDISIFIHLRYLLKNKENIWYFSS